MQYLSSSGSTSSCRPSTSTRICGRFSACKAAEDLGVVLVCLTGLVRRLLTLTAAPPSRLLCFKVPGASRLLRRAAAVVLGLPSTPTGPGVRRPASDGVMDSRRLLRLEACGSTEAAAERREGGREGAGGVDSVFGTTLARWTLAARVVGAGVGVFEGGAADEDMLSLRGILMVPAL